MLSPQGAAVEGGWEGKDGAQSLQPVAGSSSKRARWDEIIPRGRSRGAPCLINECLIVLVIFFQAWRFRCLDQTRTVDSFVQFTPWQDMLVWDWVSSSCDIIFWPRLLISCWCWEDLFYHNLYRKRRQRHLNQKCIFRKLAFVLPTFNAKCELCYYFYTSRRLLARNIRFEHKCWKLSSF